MVYDMWVILGILLDGLSGISDRFVLIYRWVALINLTSRSDTCGISQLLLVVMSKIQAKVFVGEWEGTSRSISSPGQGHEQDGSAKIVRRSGARVSGAYRIHNHG